ncbi:hypothetical protein SCT_1907 [Sulfuricella sp. T08]|uniref:hypothetical protein n=1 Tax=Sulfuricella sp. T08 TaxID=1632857 RepID=UPI000617981C|nr:hypothetical protein [Sulfuricella sp. T08]GAO36499.1 hypothetical protein SCT_1907 [Sulfuricella sp. T08]
MPIDELNMDLTTVYSKTAKGVQAITQKDKRLPANLARALSLVDGRATVEEILEKAGELPTSALPQTLADLAKDGYLKAVAREPFTQFSITPDTSASMVVSETVDETFFRVLAETEARKKLMKEAAENPQEARQKSQEKAAAMAEEEAMRRKIEAREAAEADERSRQEAVQRKIAEAMALEETTFRARKKAESQALREKAEKDKAEAEERARREAQEQAAKEAEIRAAAERRAQEEAEERARHEAEQQKIAEAKAREEAERKAREEAEKQALREKAEKDRAEAEQQARGEAQEQAAKEAEIRAAAERRAQEEAEERARHEAEQQKIAEAKARQEAEARAIAEAEERARREAEAREEAERKAREEAESQALREKAEKEKAEAEERIRKEAQDRAAKEAHIRAEAERKAQEEAAAKARAEVSKQLRMEARAREEAERKKMRALEKAEARAKAEAAEEARAEARRQLRLEARAREEAELNKAREEAEAKAKAEAEEQKRLEAEAEERARREAEEKARAEEEARIQAEAEAKEREEAERKAREDEEAREKREAEVRAIVEAEEKARAEEAARLKAEADAKEREEAERKAREEAEARAIAEAEEWARQEAEEKIRAQEEALAKARAEAERKAREEEEQEERERAEIEVRARALANARAEETEKAQQKALAKPKIFKHPVKLGKAVLISLAALILLPLVMLHVMSLNVFIPPIEKLASDRMHEPVSIHSMRASLWPAPHLQLEGITIGKLRDIKIPTIRVMPEPAAFFGEIKTIKAIEVESVTIDQDAVTRVIAWVGPGDSAEKIQVRRIAIKTATIEVKGIPLPPFEADVALAATGKFEHANIRSADKKIEVAITPKNEGFEVNIVANDWQPPLWPNLTFTELHAKAMATSGGMKFSEIESRLYSGKAKGSATIKWGDLWSAEGDLNIENVLLAGAMPALTNDIALSGKLDAKTVYSMQARDLGTLFVNPRIKASFNVRDGSIGNIDLARAIQPRANETTGGKTLFANLSGSMTLDGQRYQYRQMKLAAGLLTASGEADIMPDKKLSGKTSVEMKLRSSTVSARLTLSGDLKQPVLRR